MDIVVASRWLTVGSILLDAEKEAVLVFVRMLNGSDARSMAMNFLHGD
jgi:hypothetical protein